MYLLFILWLGTLPTQFVFAIETNIQSQPTGIWSIAGTRKVSRWVVIHNLEEAKSTGIYHIEVIQRAVGAPVWSIKRIIPHMAITTQALQRSVIKPLNSGAVYPESFYDAFAKWKNENNGAGGNICDTSIAKCSYLSPSIPP